MSEQPAVPLEAGQAVVLDAGLAHVERWLRTTVVRVDRRIAWVDGAPEGQSALHLTPGQEVRCHTWRPMDALYMVRGRVMLAQVAPRPLVGLKVLESTRVQQRAYVRVPLSTEAGGAVLRPSGDLEALTLQVLDLSAGGLRGRCSTALQPGDALELSLPLPVTAHGPAAPVHVQGRAVRLADLPSPLNVRAQVVRLVEGETVGAAGCEVGVAFMDVSVAARERIVRVALNVQLDRRRRGLL
ncbi:MAG: PilZ domain-containing protein [Chloroflexi bacterium]|nr:PilZ domain-containing protein [Chloroflexota bacterium]